MGVKSAILLNPAAGASEQGATIRALTAERDDVVVFEMEGAASCIDIVQEAVRAGCCVIGAAGGDGTVHDVANAILMHEFDVALGVIPLGTGNDFARTIGVGMDPRDAVAALVIGRVERFDVLRVDTNGRSLYGINAVTGGFSGDVTESLSPELKNTFGPLAYIIGTVSALPEISEYRVSLKIDDGAPVATEAVAVVAANGRTIAGGKRIASLANPQDGLMDVVIVRPSSLLNLADVGARLVAGNLPASKHVDFHRARRLIISGETSMQFNVDGEVLDTANLTITLLASALSVVVGPDYTAEIKP